MVLDHQVEIGHIRQLERFQNKVHEELEEYVKLNYPNQPERPSKLLLRLPALRLLSPSVMEELFFAGLIGNVQIDSIIPYILRMETAEYNSQVADSDDTSEVSQDVPSNTIVVSPASIAK